MTFKEFLATKKASSDAGGDIKRLASVARFPDVTSAEDLRNYIFDTYGDGPMIEAGATLWKAYDAALK